MRLFPFALLVGAVCAALSLLLPIPSHSAPPEGADPRLAPWFQSLESPSGKSCCSIADCRPVS
jgi:hypothetical protein